MGRGHHVGRGNRDDGALAGAMREMCAGATMFAFHVRALTLESISCEPANSEHHMPGSMPRNRNIIAISKLETYEIRPLPRACAPTHIILQFV